VLSSTLEQNKALVRRYFEEINSFNAGVLDELLLPDYVDHNPPPVPNLAPGLAGARQAFEVARRAFPDGWHIIEDQLADGDKVLTYLRAGGTFAEELIGIPPTGKPVSMSGMAVHRIAHGKLAEHWGVQDLAGLFQQIGLMPAGPQAQPAATGPQAQPAATGPQAQPAATGPQAQPAAAPAPAAAGAPASGAPMDRDAMRGVMERFADIFNKHDLSIADEVLAPTFQATFIGMPPLPTPEAWKQLVGPFMAAFPDMQLVVHDEFVEGDKAGGRWIWTATHRGELMGMPATGRSVTVQGLGIYRLAGGKIVSETVLEDMFGMLVQLGVVPPPGQPAAATPTSH
jgi:steroid delta-isomerase-like uncharacterized protein